MDKKILILGSSGFLGRQLTPYLINIGYKVFRPSTKIIKSKMAFQKISRLIKKEGINTVINLIANTNVDFCEHYPLRAYESNVGTLEKFMDVFAYSDIHFIHISTDQVYFGNGPHLEENPHPINVYGKTKLLAEYVAMNFNSTILRTNFVGKSDHKERLSFSDWIINSVRDQKKITLFDDVLFSPLAVSDICGFIHIVIQKNNRGLYNLGSRDVISKAEFGFELLKNLGIGSECVSKGNYKDHNKGVSRPNDMSLDVKKFERDFCLTLPTMNETIRNVYQQYKS